MTGKSTDRLCYYTCPAPLTKLGRPDLARVNIAATIASRQESGVHGLPGAACSKGSLRASREFSADCIYIELPAGLFVRLFVYRAGEATDGHKIKQNNEKKKKMHVADPN